MNAEKVHLINSHNKTLDRLHSFYQNIAYGMSCSGRIVRTAVQSGAAAKQIMDELAKSEYCHTRQH